jgi:hypothetical protein
MFLGYNGPHYGEMKIPVFWDVALRGEGKYNA